MKILIDLSNSPHVLFFRPIIKKLEEKGHTVDIIARDHAQTKQLLDLFGMEYALIGKHAGKSIYKKLWNAISRVLEIARYISKKKPDLCLSQQSPYIIWAAFLKGRKSIYLFDNDQAKQQNSLTFPLATKIICPEAVKVKGKKFIKYPGVKEAVYISSWKFNYEGLEKIKKIKKKKILIRTEITSAAYHEGKDLLNLVKKLSKSYQIIISPRTKKQREAYKEIKEIIILDSPPDGPSLIKSVNLVMGGGGTMNREAATLGVPVISLYSGKLLEVDKDLIRQGLMIHQNELEDQTIEKLLKRGKQINNLENIGKEAIKKIICEIEGAI